MIMKSAVPTLPVTNMAEGVDFYHGTLGFEIKHQETDYAVLSCDRVSLHLWAASDESWRKRKGERAVVSGVESFIAGTHSCRIEVEGIEEIHQDLQPKGTIHLYGELANKPWGTREFAVLDPYGNLVTFLRKLNSLATKYECPVVVSDYPTFTNLLTRPVITHSTTKMSPLLSKHAS